MKTFIAVLFSACILFVSGSASAQYEPQQDARNLLSFGLGFSGWGIPIYGRFEVPVYENITVGGALSYQSKSESFFTGSDWRHTIFGINGRGNYHFNELIEINNDWDVYAGLSLGYYIWNTKLDNDLVSLNYTGSGSGGFNLGIHVGGRYFVKDNLGINVEFGGGTVLAGGTIGVTFLL